eukprot:XP_019920636.1 PREDICTED: uncharacterized protein LOC105322820 isoform X2 [Crassostrea gigas]
MNGILLSLLLLCTVNFSQCCWKDHDCHDQDCQYGSSCRHRSCRCIECLEDGHCQCSAGQISECRTFHIFGHTSNHCACHDSVTTQQPFVKLECNHQKISVIESIAENLHVEDSRAELCPGTTKHQTSEAFVINKCNSKARSFWSKGEQVKTECSNDEFSPYTPISTFSDQGNMAAFLIDCTKTTDGVVIGLTIAVQTCNDAPMIMNLNETSTPRMSDFYTILQRI